MGLMLKRLDVARGWDIQLIFQWHEPWCFWRWNWVNFDFCHLGFEAGRCEGTYIEIIVVILGVGAMIEWHDRQTRVRWLAQMDQRVAEAKESMGIEGEDFD